LKGMKLLIMDTIKRVLKLYSPTMMINGHSVINEIKRISKPVA